MTGGPTDEDAVSFDTSVPHIARVYDYWLGGKDNFAADRMIAEQIIGTLPEIRLSVRAQRAFLGRAVHYLTAEAGIRQFLDIGTGLPSANNTHEVAQRVAPESLVVYVDNDRCKSGCAHARWAIGLPEESMGSGSGQSVPACPDTSLPPDSADHQASVRDVQVIAVPRTATTRIVLIF